MILNLLNRTQDAAQGFTLPADGWYQLAPIGEHPHHHAGGVVQIIDRAAVDSIVNSFRSDQQRPNFAGVLVDFDHFSLNGEKSSEAGGWITELANRDDGLWAQIRWTDTGEAAVKGGRYRFLSPVWRREDCQDLGNSRLRPVRLLNAALTNDKNLKTLRPLTNRNETKEPTMDPIRAKLIEYLSLDDTADDAAILAAMDDVMSAEDIGAITNRAEEAEAVAKELAKQTADLQIALANRDLEPFAAVLDDKSKDFWIDAILANRDEALKQLGVLANRKPTETRQPLHNRAAAIPPTGITAAAKEAGKDEQKAAAILNRAQALSRKENISFTAAFSRVQQEENK